MQKFNKKTGRLIVTKLLPHNFLAEKIVLSSLLISSEARNICFRTLKDDTFYFKNHQEIYKTIILMHKRKLSIDIITLYTFLQDNGLLEEVGGVTVLIELINQIPNLVYIEEYIRLLQDKFLRRSLIKLGYKAINSGYITSVPLETILTDFEFQLLNLTNEIKDEKISNSADLFSKIFLNLKQKSLKPSLSGVASGFYDLDSFTQGFQKSDLIIIAGRPSMGKTAFSLNIAINVIRKYKLPVLFFSLEMSNEQLVYRIISTETNILNTTLKKGQLLKEDWIKVNRTIKVLSKLPLYMDDTPNNSIQNIRAKIKKVIFEHNNLGLIIIDYLQLMQDSKFKGYNRTQELSQITRLLKNIAREFKVPLIALSQLSRNIETRINKRPILSDLRESGSIEQDADLVLMLYREDYYTPVNQAFGEVNITEIIIAKQRNGPIGSAKLKFDSNCTKFTSLKT